MNKSIFLLFVVFSTIFVLGNCQYDDTNTQINATPLTDNTFMRVRRATGRFSDDSDEYDPNDDSEEYDRDNDSEEF